MYVSMTVYKHVCIFIHMYTCVYIYLSHMCIHIHVYICTEHDGEVEHAHEAHRSRLVRVCRLFGVNESRVCLKLLRVDIGNHEKMSRKHEQARFSSNVRFGHVLLRVHSDASLLDLFQELGDVQHVRSLWPV